MKMQNHTKKAKQEFVKTEPGSKLTKKVTEFVQNKDLDKRGKWNPQILKRYVLFQIPAIVILTLLYFLINEFYPIPVLIFLVFIAIWILKDIILYPFTWKAYDVRRTSIEQALVGEKGIVIKSLNPEGHVRIKGEIWKAQIQSGGANIKKGSKVIVERANGLKLIVAPDKH
jgi:membrane-bound serine protease (ClpP class)